MGKAKLTTLGPGESKETWLSVIERDGGVIVRDLLEPGLLDQLNTELEAYIAAYPPGSRSDEELWKLFHGPRTTRFCGLSA